MSKVEKTIYGGVGVYATILSVDEVDNHSKILNKGPTRDVVCCIKEPGENYSDVALIEEFKDLPIQNTLADPKGISRAAASVPNAVALSSATATPLIYDIAQFHFNEYKYNSKDVKELGDKGISDLKNVLMAETGNPSQYIGELKDNQIKEVEKSEKIKEANKQYDNLTILKTPHNQLKLNLVHYLNRS